MSNEIVLKYFIKDGKLHELVYHIDKALYTELHEKAQRALEEKIKAVSLTQATYIKQLTESDCLNPESSRRVSILDAKITQALKIEQLEAVKAVFNPPAALAPPTGPVLTIKDTDNCSGCNLNQLLDTLARNHLNLTPTEQTDFDHSGEKADIIIAKLPELLRHMTPQGKKALLARICKSFISYLETPHALLELTATDWGKLLQIIAQVMSPQAKSAQEVLKYLHPHLRENKALLENLKVFNDRMLAEALLKEPITAKLKAQHEEMIASCAPGTLDQTFETLLGINPNKAVATAVLFLQNLGKFINAHPMPSAPNPWSFSETLELPGEDTLWNVPSDELLSSVLEDDANDIPALQDMLKTEMERGYPLCLQARDASGNLSDIPIANADELMEKIAHLPLSDQKQILVFLKQNTLRYFADKQIAPQTIAPYNGFLSGELRLRYNFTIVLSTTQVPPTYDLLLDYNYMIHMQAPDKPSLYRKMQAVQLYIPHERRRSRLKQTTDEVTAFDALDVALSLQNLSTNMGISKHPLELI